MKDSIHLIEKAAKLLANCKLSGPSIALCEAVITQGFADEGPAVSDEDFAFGRQQRSRIAELCQLHGL